MSVGRPETWQGELQAAVDAARAGGAAAMRHYGAVTASLKAGGSPVTAADHAANDAILSLLAERFPADAVLSEESKDSAHRLDAARVWVVDPLDGTKEFIARNGEFAVMVGLAVDGDAVLGAVYQPAVDRLFCGVVGGGAWMEERGERMALECPPCDPRALRLVGSRSHPDALLVEMQSALGITDVQPSGSVGVKCGLIARGERDLYVHPVPYLKEWDTCAPEAVLRGAGGWVSDCLGEPLRYNKPDPVQPHGILAHAPGAEDAVQDRLMPLYAAAR
jgi:3'(2'), 5'-bisphosphate nucleotidase